MPIVACAVPLPILRAARGVRPNWGGAQVGLARLPGRPEPRLRLCVVSEARQVDLQGARPSIRMVRRYPSSWVHMLMSSGGGRPSTFHFLVSLQTMLITGQREES